MTENDKYDLFIAYYGNNTTGSENSAAFLYDKLVNINIGENWLLKPYFHPRTNPYGNFEETPCIVARTPLFLMVVDKGIPRNDVGQLERQRDDGTLRNLFEEVRSFHDSQMYKSQGGDSAAKIYIADDFDFKSAECLNPMFSGRTALTNVDDTIEWVKHFYNKIYPERMHKKYVMMVKTNKEEFVSGRWTSEAERLWKHIKHQGIARALTMYNLIKMNEGDVQARSRVQQLYRDILNESPLEQQTCDILSVASAQLNDN